MTLTEEDIKKIDEFVTAYNEGGMKAAAKASGLDRVQLGGYVASALRRIGVSSMQKRGRTPAKSRKWSAEEIALAKSMRRAGVTDREVASHFGVTVNALWVKFGARKLARPTAEQFLAMKHAGWMSFARFSLRCARIGRAPSLRPPN